MQLIGDTVEEKVEDFRKQLKKYRAYTVEGETLFMTEEILDITEDILNDAELDSFRLFDSPDDVETIANLLFDWPNTEDVQDVKEIQDQILEALQGYKTIGSLKVELVEETKNADYDWATVVEQIAQQLFEEGFAGTRWQNVDLGELAQEWLLEINPDALYIEGRYGYSEEEAQKVFQYLMDNFKEERNKYQEGL